MKTLVCSDFDEFVDALPGLEGEYILRAPQTRDWALRHIDLGGIVFTVGSEGAARIYNGVARKESFHVYTFLARHAAVAIDGVCVPARQLGWIPPGRTFHVSTRSPASWLNVTIDAPLLREHAGVYLDPSSLDPQNRGVAGSLGVSPDGLIHLARRLFRESLCRPDRWQESKVAHIARAQVMEAIANAVAHPCEDAPRHRVNRRRVLDRVLGLLDAMGDETLSTLDVCRTAACSERTLRNVFHDYFDMSPHQYLAMRRLHAIRAAIRRSNQNETITSICSRYGVWDYGRFASAYRSHFGIFPSQAIQQHRH